MSYITSKELCAQIRKQLSAEFPQLRFSVSKHDYTGGRSISVVLMQGPQDPFTHATVADRMGEVQLNHYTLRRSKNYAEAQSDMPFDISTGERAPMEITEWAWLVMKRADEIANAQNWDRGDVMTDYFDVNYYLHLAVGKWGRHYQIIKPKNLRVKEEVQL